MKKFVFFSLLFIMFMKCASASSDTYYINVNGKDYLYEEKIINEKYAFLLGIDETIDIKYSRVINNLAYIANLKNNYLYNVVIQMLIWQNVYPEYEFYIKCNDNKIDISNIIKDINNLLSNYDIKPNIDGNHYQVNYLEKLIIDTNVNLANYYFDECAATVQGLKAELTFNHVGSKIIHFTSLEIKKIENYIYADSVYYKPFEITVDVIANIVDLNFILDEDNYNFKYGIFDLNNNLIQEFYLDANNNKVYFEKGIDVYLKELTDASTYELSEDILLKDQDEEYSIDIYKKKKNFDILIDTEMYYYGDNESITKTYSDVNIYNDKMELINSKKCSNNCSIKLEAGKYIFEDNVSKYKVFVDLVENREVVLKRYYVAGLITTENIDKICINEQCLEIEKMGNFINFMDFVLPNIYEIYINGKSYELNLLDNKNYIYLNDYGLVYNYLKEDEEVEKVEDNNIKTEEDQENITISIPDTGIEIKFIKEYYYVKKRINYSIRDNISCHYI